MALPALRLVAALAALAPLATLAADCPPTVVTTVLLCVPVTSPDNEPVKFPAVVAFPARLPLKLVAVTMPATCNALRGLLVPMPTPPTARMRN